MYLTMTFSYILIPHYPLITPQGCYFNIGQMLQKNVAGDLMVLSLSLSAFLFPHLFFLSPHACVCACTYAHCGIMLRVSIYSVRVCL